MSLISIPNTFTVGAVIVASQHNSNFSVIYSDYNGNIDNTNIAANAAIADTKLSQITTASKVSATAITGLASLPAGAGVVPVANLGTGASSTNFLRGDGAFSNPAFGTPETGKSLTTVYQASSDGFIIVQFNFNGGGSIASFFNDTSNPPTTLQLKIGNYDGTNNNGFMWPVKANSYYKITSTSGSDAVVIYSFWPL